MTQHQTNLDGFDDTDTTSDEDDTEFDHTDVRVPRGWTRDPTIDGFAVRNNYTGSLFRVIGGATEWTFSNEHGRMLFNDADTRETAVKRAVDVMQSINELVENIDNTELTDFATIWQELGEPDETQMEVAWNVWNAKQQEDTPIGDDTGSLKILFETWEHTHKTHDREADEWKERDITRKPGVYLPRTRVNDGTMVQNDETVLKHVASELLTVAERAAADDWDVYGVGKNHDDTMLIYADTPELNARYDGKHYIAGTPFTDCTIMGIPSKWWDHAERSPSMQVGTVRAYRQKHMNTDD